MEALRPGNVEAVANNSTKRFTTQRNCDASQESDVREVFKLRGYSVWISLPEFPHQHEFNRAIHNLRKRDDLNIENRTERASKKNGRPVTLSFYRLNPGSWRELRGKPDRPAGDTHQSRAEWFEREFGKPKPAADTTDSTTIELPLFDVVKP